MMTSSTWAGSMPARAIASLMAIEPSWGAVNPFRVPRNLPVGVRTAERMTESRIRILLGGGRGGARVLADSGQVARGGGQEGGAQLGIGNGLRGGHDLRGS